MRFINSFRDFNPANGACITIGNFDGVHKGHQSLIELAANLAQRKNLEPLLITFWPHPRLVLANNGGHAPLSTREERLERLGRAGIKNILELPFTPELAAMSASDFVHDYLLPMNLRHLVVGHDFNLGKAREGNVPFLRQLAEKWKFAINQAPALLMDGEPVSSTRLRKCLRDGNVEEAARLLGRPYKVCGIVVHGRGAGTGMGFPTANLGGIDVLLPASGVYATIALCNGRKYRAITNIGTNPTFHGASLSVESFLLDCQLNLYTSPLCLEFVARIRGEIAFPTADALIARIEQDVNKAKAIFAKNAANL